MNQAIAPIPQAAHTPPFANEPVRSKVEYHKKYRLKPLTEQLAILKRYFGILSPSDVPAISLPAGAEGLFAIPRWGVVDYSYGPACRTVFEMLQESLDGRFYNGLEGKMSHAHIRQTDRTAAALERIRAQQNGDVLFVPCNFGLRHRGRSIQGVRSIFGDGEFGLGVFAVGCMLLTHPERLGGRGMLWVDCPGDEYARMPNEFALAVQFGRMGGRTRVDSTHISSALASVGSATGFIPQ